MKKSILSLLLFSNVLIAIFLSSTTTAMALTTDEVRIYINPGHGSWGPNNRHMATIGHENISSDNPDTTDFYESNTNLYKGFGLLEELINYGIPFDRTKNQNNSNANRIGAALDLTQNLVMSRVKSGPYPYKTVNGVSPDSDNDFNRTLSTIAAEVEYNNFDMFISIHSNALTEGSTTNYPLLIYRGYDDNDYAKGSKAMSTAVSAYLYDNPLDVFSSSSTSIKGDISLQGSSTTNSMGYTGYYGVLKHGVPGYLSEGYFHTYHPGRHRAMNFDYCRMEGVRYARGVAKYFGWSVETNGYIAGHVKDKTKSVSNSLYKYKSGSHDAYYPLNGATVELYDNENVLLDTYKVDNNYNGVFVFFNLKPGNYKLISRVNGYSDLLQEVTVSANNTSYVMMYPVAGSEEIELVETTPNYPDIAPEEVTLEDSYEFTTKIESAQITELTGKTIRRAIMRDGLFYVLALNADNTPNIYVIDPETQSVKTTLSTTGVVMRSNGGGTGVAGYNYSLQLPLSDIAFTADGYLLACNNSLNQDDAKATSGIDRGYFRVYKWEKGTDNIPTGNPVEIISTTHNGFFYYAIVGYSFAVTGSLDNCKIATGAMTTSNGNGYELRFLEIDYKNGTTTIKNARNNSAKSFTRGSVGDKYQLDVSPINRTRYIVNGENGVPMEVNIFADTNSTGAYIMNGNFSFTSLV